MRVELTIRVTSEILRTAVHDTRVFPRKVLFLASV